MADTELAEVADFLAGHAPFAALPEPVLRALPRRLTIRYHRRGAHLMAVGVDSDDLYIVRSGAIEIRDADGVLVDRVAEGATAGSTTLVGSDPSRFDVVAIEDTLALHLPREVFHELSAAHPAFADHFDAERADRLRMAADQVATNPAGQAILRTSGRDLVRQAGLVTVPVDATIREAAVVMSTEEASSVLVLDGRRIAGVLTDRDLRRRVVARGIDLDGPVAEVMTPDPVVVSAETSAIELLLTMTERGIHHLPLVEGGRPVGVVTSTDLMRLERANAVHLVGDITQQHDVAGVAEMARRIPRLVEQLVDQDVGAHDITRVVTSVGDAVERRLITLAEEELREQYGPPPRYCWMALGSRARHEQALGSDQDHALILADDAPEGAEEHLAALAARVVDGLEAAGYPRCPGDVMASNPRWRQRLSGWRREFRQWIHEPVPDAVLGASIFFDSRPIHGDDELHARLVEDIAAWAPRGQAFLAHLTKEAVANEPPLGFFRDFVLARAGEHKDTLDLKRGGVGAIVDLARVHALGAGLVSVNTRERLLAAGRSGGLGGTTAASLVDALEFISHVRLAHQARQAAGGAVPDSRVRPSELTAFERRALREAFQVVREAQQTLAHGAPGQYYT